MQFTRSVQIQRSFPLLVLAALSLVFLSAAARADAATQLLPDLQEQVPANVGIDGGTGNWMLTFDSEVVNHGNGPLQIHGHRSSASGNMTADQIVAMSDGSTTTVGGIGQLHYETSFDHRHWHFQPFNHYELRKLDGTLIGTDIKQGFCLGDNDAHGGLNRVFTDWCRQDHPEVLEVTEGLSVGYGDKYQAGLELQDIPINPTSFPTGDYNLVHRVNTNPDGSHPVHETNYNNNIASVEVHISWSGGKPSVGTLKSCPGTASCGPIPPTPPGGGTPTPPPPGGGTTPPPGGGTTPGGGNPGSIPIFETDIIAPKLLLGTKALHHLSGSQVFIYTSCDEACIITAQGTISIAGPARVLRTGKTTLNVPAGIHAKVGMRLSRSLRAKLRHALAHHMRVRVRTRITVADSAGNHSTRVQKFRLVR